MSLLSGFFDKVRGTWAFLGGLIWVSILHSLWRRSSKGGQHPWVIGGHRGRMYSDNSAAVEAEARREGRSIIWIANRHAAASIRSRGARVLIRGSWAARRAISRAPVLIYSHGEDDLDLLMILLRGRTALRVSLDHGLCLLKAGGVTDPHLARAPALVRWVKTWLITRWDVALCASEEVRRNFQRAYPMNGGLELHGGAHFDEWKADFGAPPKKRIYWFPTFRDTASGRAELARVTEEITRSARLANWLKENGYEFHIGSHINSEKAASELQAPFVRASLSQLTTDIRQSALLISDYSSVMFDFLLLERPQLLFAFDLSDYLKSRVLFCEYESLTFGLHPRTSAELIEMIVSGAWQSAELASAARAKRKLCLPADSESFARDSVRAIAAHVEERD